MAGGDGVAKFACRFGKAGEQAPRRKSTKHDGLGIVHVLDHADGAAEEGAHIAHPVFFAQAAPV